MTEIKAQIALTSGMIRCSFERNDLIGLAGAIGIGTDSLSAVPVVEWEKRRVLLNLVSRAKYGNERGVYLMQPHSTIQTQCYTSFSARKFGGEILDTVYQRTEGFRNRASHALASIGSKCIAVTLPDPAEVLAPIQRGKGKSVQTTAPVQPNAILSFGGRDFTFAVPAGEMFDICTRWRAGGYER